MNTRDILNIVLAICAVVFTGFFAMFFYYLVQIVRDLRKTSQAIHEKVEQVGGILQSVRDRLSDSVSALSILTSIIGKLASSWQQRRTSKRTRAADANE